MPNTLCADQHSNWLICVCSSWLAGLLFGCRCAAEAYRFAFLLMHGFVHLHTPALAAILVCLIPFLLSYLVRHFCAGIWLLPLVSLKAFSFSFISVLLIGSFGQSGWMMRIFLMLCEIASIPFLFFYWIRKRTQKQELLLFISMLSIGMIYYYVVLPAWVRLIDS